jgi:hypothetical protein
LGIEKFPPEKSLYRSLLKETGLHSLDKKTNLWSFKPPSKSTKSGNKKHNLLPVWDQLDIFLASTEVKDRSFVELSSKLMAAPYGVKAGVLPILYVSAFLINQHELAVFENNSYRPIFTQEMVEKFIKAPDTFTFQRVRIEGKKEVFFDQYFSALGIDRGNKTLLDLATILVDTFAKLPDYTLKTQDGLPVSVKNVRAAFQLAKSPETLIFTELPQTLGYPEANELSVKSEEFSGFSQELGEVLHILKNAHIKLKNEQLNLICFAFGQENDLSVSAVRKIMLETNAKV